MPKKTTFLSEPEKTLSGKEKRHLLIRIQNALKQSRYVSNDVKALFPYL